MTELVTRPHVENFIDWSKERPEVVVVTADLTNSCEVGKWRDMYPERYVTAGMAEQNMLGVAAGLAREGFVPWLHTFAVFLYRRPYDQLAMSIAYPNLPVRLVGFLPGIATPGGVSHQAIEDVAILRATPNMTILETGDATEVESVLDVTEQVDGPVYIRMLRGVLPRLFPRSEPMRLGRARELRSGDALLLISSGLMTEQAMKACEVLAGRGVHVNHWHISTLKPFGDDALFEAISRAKQVVTMENHTIVGGLGSAVAEHVADNGLGTKVTRLGLRDTYAHGASTKYLMREYELDSAALIRVVERELGLDLKVDRDELEAVSLVVRDSSVNAELL
ncbi:MAG: transketolase family protein [Arachnia sp.]